MNTCTDEAKVPLVNMLLVFCVPPKTDLTAEVWPLKMPFLV